MDFIALSMAKDLSGLIPHQPDHTEPLHILFPLHPQHFVSSETTIPLANPPSVRPSVGVIRLFLSLSSVPPTVVIGGAELIIPHTPFLTNNQANQGR